MPVLFRSLVLRMFGVSVAAIVGCAVPAKVQEPPDAKSTLAKASSALKGLTSIEYSVQGELLGTKFTATVRQKRASVTSSGLMEGVYLVSGELDRGTEGRERFLYSYDGVSLRVLIGSGTRVEVLDNPTSSDIGRMLPFEAGMVSMPFLGGFIESGAAGWMAKEKGKRKIGDKDCPLVELSRTTKGPDGGTVSVKAEWAFDPDTHLPVGFASEIGRKTVSSLKPNENFDDSLLKLDGTEVKIDSTAAFAKGLLEVGVVAPDFKLKSSQGMERTLASYKGKIVLLDFWGTWCLPCRKAMPSLQELHSKYKDKGLSVVGVAVGDDEGNPAGFMKNNGYTYELLLDGDGMAKKYQAVVLPTLYLLDKDGKVLYRQSGFREAAKAEIAAIVEKHLN